MGRGVSLALSFTLLAAVLLAGPGAGRAHACSCAAAEESAADAARTSEAVFAGEVVDVRDASSASPEGGPVTFDVSEAWKGVSEERVVVSGYGSEPGCGVEFRVGERYLVYADRDKWEDVWLETSSCDATKPLTLAEADVEVLGSPELVLSGNVSPVPRADAGPRGAGTVAASISLVLLVLAGTGAWVLVQRRRGA